MSSLKAHDGYLMIDHRFSPGVPEALAVKSGFAPNSLRAGYTFEGATYQCAHCLGTVFKLPDRTRPRGYCAPCDSYICDECNGARLAGDYKHVSGEAVSDAILNSAVRGVALGSSLDLLTAPKIFVPA